MTDTTTTTTTFTSEPNPVDQRAAYNAGWNASRRTRTADLDAAEARFIARHGTEHVDYFCSGWVDNAADHDKWQSVPQFSPLFTGSQLAYDDVTEATRLWHAGFRPMEAQCLTSSMYVVYRATDVFGLHTVGEAHIGYVLGVTHQVWDMADADAIECVVVAHSGDVTEADPGDEVWAMPDPDADPTLPRTPRRVLVAS